MCSSQAPFVPLFPSVSRELICLARQVEMGEGGVHVWRHDRLGRAEVGFVERGKAGDAEKREANRDLVFEDLEEPYDPRSSGRSEAVDIETADQDRVGAEDHRLDDVGA